MTGGMDARQQIGEVQVMVTFLVRAGGDGQVTGVVRAGGEGRAVKGRRRVISDAEQEMYEGRSEMISDAET
jgi:hypothetical protein